jgi:LacI family transcriptional regulator
MADKKVTMKDVASAARVSTATVGRVLHNRGYVSPEARERVNTAIKGTGFRLNLVAQSLRRSRSMTLGLLLTIIVPNPFFPGIELGIEQEAMQHDYNVLIWNVLLDPARERQGVEVFIRRQMDAIIFATPQDPQNVLLAKQAGIPVIQVERPTYIHTHSVLIDNYVGATSAMEHLVQLGHRRIAFIGTNNAPPSPQDEVDKQRLAGYRDTLIRHGITPLEEWIASGDLYSIEDGYRRMQQFLELKPGISAVLVGCDIMASGVLQAIYQNNLRVPEDISVIGFDDTYAPFLTPPLTSVRQPVFDIGVSAARLAIEVLSNGSESADEFQTIHLETSLIIRSSTGVPHRYYPA